MAITAFLSRGPGGPASLGCWFSLPHLISNWLISNCSVGAGGPTLLDAGFLYHVLSPTDWTSCAPSYIIVRRPPSSCGRHKSHSFNPSTVKVISWYSSTECTCYLHRCISYFDSLAGVNMQHLMVRLMIWEVWNPPSLPFRSIQTRSDSTSKSPMFVSNCCILTFGPSKHAITKWCTGRKWHIPMASNQKRSRGWIWLMKWDKVKPMIHS